MSFTSGQCTGLASDGLGEGIPDNKETTSSTLCTEYSYSTVCTLGSVQMAQYFKWH